MAILSTLMMGLAVLAICRWEVWFHNPDETPYTAPDTPSRILLTFGYNCYLSRNVSWTCGDEVRESCVELVDETDSAELCTVVPAEGEVFESRSGKAAYYVARLRGLRVGHRYQYRVQTGDEYSDWYTFQLPSSEECETSFIYMGDIQDTIGGVANQLLREAFRRNADAEFFVSGGDLTERPTDAFWAETFASLDSVGQTLPVLTVTGNHDYLKGVVCQLERRFSLIHSYYLDSMVGDNQVFTIRCKNLQLFCLDSNRELPGLLAQRKWLKEQLTASRATWKVVVLHHPLYSIMSNSNNLIQRWVFDGLIREYGVDLVLQGHEHAYARMTQHEQGQPTTPIYTVSHCSPKNYKIEFNDRFDKFGSGSRYYQKIRTAGDTLFVAAYDALDHTLYDSLQVVKRGQHIEVMDLGQSLSERITFTPRPGKASDAAFAERIRVYQETKKSKHNNKK